MNYVVFVADLVAHKIKKVKAFKLFSKGWNPPEVADQIDVNIRTIQRWHQEFLQQNPDFAMVGKVPVIVTHVDKNPASAHLVEAEPENNAPSYSQNWVEWATSLTDSHITMHGEIRGKLANILNVCLDSSEYNVRVIQVLSQCLCRHAEAERAAAMLDALNINVAAKRLEAAGYLVMESSEAEA